MRSICRDFCFVILFDRFVIPFVSNHTQLHKIHPETSHTISVMFGHYSVTEAIGITARQRHYQKAATTAKIKCFHSGGKLLPRQHPYWCVLHWNFWKFDKWIRVSMSCSKLYCKNSHPHTLRFCIPHIWCNMHTTGVITRLLWIDYLSNNRKGVLWIHTEVFI